ncbi:hypothetical protein B0A55_05988 [Friedmanniomyces simplex]|uniref:Beta-lactamase-related domain-containing protein n=1 Tax=Friedmanniomyces simplex TaxID=329884 RepID=A0A4U0XFR1_9PEZI|nr:hypothetical protein B0A55_05988 [Friedmanniomyces simplex]
MSKLVDSNNTAYSHIDWSTKMVELIRDDFLLEDEWTTNHVTLTDALSHRSGMPRNDMSWTNGDPSVKEQVRQLRFLPLHSEIRTKFEYCNLMFAAVSHAIETVTGIAIGILLKQWFWGPLGMHATFYSIEDALAYAEETKDITVATGYQYDNAAKSHVISPHSAIPPANGAGGVISNVLDYTHWVRTFLHPEKTSNPISPAAITEMTKPHIVLEPGRLPVQFAAYGLGLETSFYRGHRIVAHEGGINGYMTAMLWLPDSDWGLVMMQNTYSLAMEIIQWKILDDFLRTTEDQRFDMAAVAREWEATTLARLANAPKELYPDAGKIGAVAPALPLTQYAGTYSHPAYHNVTLLISPEHSAGLPGAPLSLYSESAYYLNISSVWHHVSGEEWYVHEKSGPSCFLVDELKKARFRVGVDGAVKGVELQVETAIDELAWFEKVT